LAIHYLNGEKNTQKVIETLGMMEKRIPRNVISMDYRIKHDVANLYNLTGDNKKYNEYAEEVIEAAKNAIKLNPMDVSSWYNPYRLLLTHYENMGRYNDAIELLLQLKTYIPNDPGIDSLISSFRKMSGGQKPEIEK
jgi:tetratricopeptide (TPR) repeat protein